MSDRERKGILSSSGMSFERWLTPLCVNLTKGTLFLLGWNLAVCTSTHSSSERPLQWAVPGPCSAWRAQHDRCKVTSQWVRVRGRPSGKEQGTHTSDTHNITCTDIQVEKLKKEEGTMPARFVITSLVTKRAAAVLTKRGPDTDKPVVRLDTKCLRREQNNWF